MSVDHPAAGLPASFGGALDLLARRTRLIASGVRGRTPGTLAPKADPISPDSRPGCFRRSAIR